MFQMLPESSGRLVALRVSGKLTPTSASWLNLVERFFRDLTQQALLPGSFQSVKQLVDAIDTYLAQHNLAAKRYLWRADGTDVLRKIDRAWKAALEE